MRSRDLGGSSKKSESAQWGKDHVSKERECCESPYKGDLPTGKGNRRQLSLQARE